jgi:LPXTG-motif cell wall-anchored protein
MDRVGVGLLLLMLAAGAVGATEVDAIQASIPSTTAHLFSSRPMIAGTVVSVNDHQMIVDTEQGERIALEVDTRTMAPRDLGPGTTVRTEFSALENCRFHADRVIAVRPGMSGQRLQAYANTGHEDMLRVATYAGTRKTNSNSYADVRTAGYDRPVTTTSAGTVPRAVPGTSEHLFSSRPLISGTVLAVNDHRLVVESDQGQKVAMVMDSRTMVPREIAPGSIVRAEFKQMQDRRYYAQRISVVAPGTLMGREQAYANTHDPDVSVAGIVGDCEDMTPAPGNAASAVSASAVGHEGHTQVASNEEPTSTEPVAQNTDMHHSDETLPETASDRPLLLVFGLLALASAGLFAFARRIRSA